MTAAATPPGPSDGRRDNGLPSAEWGALVDLDPRLSSALLDSLAAEGVAAYVEPAGDTAPAALRPLDRLWVDPSRAEQARGVVTSEVAVLSARLAEQEPDATAYGLVWTAPSDDEMFRQIVADFSRESTDPVPRWPVSEDVGETSRRTDNPPQRRRSDRPPAPEELPSWIEPAALADEGHYDPPPPPKVPRPRLRTVLAALMVLVGLAVLFAPFQVGLDDSVIYLLLGLLLTGGGAGLIVTWMRDAPPTDSGPDDGAVV